MAFAHFVLAEMGEGDPGRMSTLYDERERLDIYGKALLALALDKVDVKGEDSRAQTLLDDIAGQAQLSASGAHWQESEDRLVVDEHRPAHHRDCAARLQPSAPGRSAPAPGRALADGRRAEWALGHHPGKRLGHHRPDRLDGEQRRTGRGLRLAGDAQRRGTGRGQCGPGQCGRADFLAGQVADLLRYEANALHLSRSNDSGQLYYTAQLRYFLDATAISARDRGWWSAAASWPRTVKSASSSAAVGDVLSVTVSLNVPTDAHFLCWKCPSLRGRKPSTRGLATTSNEFGGPEFGTGGLDPWQEFWWRYWVPTHTDIRDEKVALFADHLARGQLRIHLPGAGVHPRRVSGLARPGRADVLPGCVGPSPPARWSTCDGIGEARRREANAGSSRPTQPRNSADLGIEGRIETRVG